MKSHRALVTSGIALVLFAVALPAQTRQSFPPPRSGPWECVDSTGVHGVFFEGDSLSPHFYVYERLTGGRSHGGYFTLDPRYSEGPNKTALLDNRLTIHFENNLQNRPPFDLDLKFDPAGHRWTGSWSDCIVEGGAILERPRPRTGTTPSPLVGDWKEERVSAPLPPGSQGVRRNGAESSAFLHVRQSVDGQILAWLTRIGPTVKLHLRNDNHAITLNPNNYFGRSYRYEGHLSADRATIAGHWIRDGLDTIPTIYRIDKPPLKPDARPTGFGFWLKLGIAFAAACVISFMCIALRNRLQAR